MINLLILTKRKQLLIYYTVISEEVKVILIIVVSLGHMVWLIVWHCCKHEKMKNDIVIASVVG